MLIEAEGRALRGTFVIDPAGKIKIMEVHDNGIGRAAKELLRKGGPRTSLVLAVLQTGGWHHSAPSIT